MYRIWKRWLPGRLRRRLMVGFYEAAARADRGGELAFLNHGFDDDAAPEGLDLPDDPAGRHGALLYERLAREIEWRGCRVLEISAGQGGGADWLFRSCRPKQIIGVDIACAAVARATERFGRDGLSFEVADALDLPFSAGAFDIVVNVESSLNYASFEKFLAEVDRVLAPGGHLLLADYRSQRKRVAFEAAVSGLGYETIWSGDMTAGVLAGFDATAAAKRDLIDRTAPRPLRPLARRVADLAEDGTASGRQRFADGRRVYLGFALRKPG